MVRINERFAIRADDHNILLCERVEREKKDKTKEMVWNTIGYHATLPQALTSLYRRLQREMINSKNMSLEQAIYESSRLERKVFEFGAGKLDGKAPE